MPSDVPCQIAEQPASSFKYVGINDYWMWKNISPGKHDVCWGAFTL